jgi:(p)ppGpp synthase/HD superfamily hydrolase
MILTEQQLLLFDFVEHKHKEQKRKYTGEPYTTHLLSVAEIVSKYDESCIEIAMCHDLFEDTNCNFDELYKKMVEIGFERHYSYDVCKCVTELTDVFTHEDFPYLNRAKRKENEAKRLGKISERSQTVKYADLIDNTSSIVKHDKEFAKTYLKEKKRIIELMTNGNKELFDFCKQQLSDLVLW